MKSFPVGGVVLMAIAVVALVGWYQVGVARPRIPVEVTCEWPDGTSTTEHVRRDLLAEVPGGVLVPTEPPRIARRCVPDPLGIGERPDHGR